MSERASIPLEERHPPIGWVLRRFQLNIDVLREMLSDMGPVLRNVDDREMGPDALAALNVLEEQEQEQLRAALRATYDRIDAEVERRREAGEALDSPISLDPSEAGFEGWQPVFGDRYVFGRFVERRQRLASGPSRVLIFNNSLLTMAISAFEVLVAGLVVRYYIAHPNAMGTDRNEFSLEDLRSFGDLNDAADDLLARRVSELMHGGFDDWAKWFKENCKANLSDYAIDYEAVRESFQRRHIVIHNGGLVSSQYVAKVVHRADPPEVGTRLTIDDGYLRGVFDQLDALGTATAVMAWGTWCPEDRDQTASELLRRSYDLMLLCRWEAVEQLASLGGRLKTLDALELSLKCNLWLSRRELRGAKAIRKEVEAWDTSALSGRYKLVREVLLEDLDAAMAMLPGLVRSKEVSWGELREWPILRTLREHPDFAETSASLRPGKDLPESAETETMDR